MVPSFVWYALRLDLWNRSCAFASAIWKAVKYLGVLACVLYLHTLVSYKPNTLFAYFAIITVISKQASDMIYCLTDKNLLSLSITITLCLRSGRCFKLPECATLKTHIPENSVLLRYQIERAIKLDNLDIA